MHAEHKIGVVIPAKNEAEFIQKVLGTLPPWVDLAVVIDDGSTDGTSKAARSTSMHPRLEIVRLEGEGVGAAINAGHQHLSSRWDEPFVSVVMAGDGQMDPSDLVNVVDPVCNGSVDHAKGERKSDDFNGMPPIRRIATAILAFFTSLACGQRILDPQCGYTATHSRVLKAMNWSAAWKGYGYPNHWLITMARNGYRIGHVPVKSVYGNETSGLTKWAFFSKVGWMMVVEHHRRAVIWLHPANASWGSYACLLSYLMGWWAWASVFTGDVAYGALALIAWWLAHIFDRVAVRRHKRRREDAAI